MENKNEFTIGKLKYIWKHKRDGKGTAYLASLEEMGHWIGTMREGALRLEQGEWVFTRGAFSQPWPTGTAVMSEAKQIVQVRLTMEAAHDN